MKRKRHFGKLEGLYFCDDSQLALAGASALVVITEWDQFRHLDFVGLRALMSGRAIFDGRNMYDPREVAQNGFQYFGLGRGQ